jgi:hypothetical protein
MLVPVVILLFMLQQINIPFLRIATILLISFAGAHGVYHLLLLSGVGVPLLSNLLDFASVVLLFGFGLYYTLRLS